MIKLLTKILRKLSLLQYFNFYCSKKVGQRHFKIPILGNLGISNLPVWESWMLDLLKIITKIEDTKFVDIGVNIGQTLLSIKSVCPDIDYIGFEPNPACNYYLEKLIDANTLGKVKIIPTAVSTEDGLGQLDFYYDFQEDASASIIQNLRPTNKIYKSVCVPTLKGETIKKTTDFNNMSILKIDVEGAELEVLLSLKELIKENTPLILLEILPIYSKERVDSLNRQKRIEKFMQDLDYSLYRIIKNNNTLLGLKKIEEIEIHADLNLSDYLCVPLSKTKAFLNHCSKIILT